MKCSFAVISVRVVGRRSFFIDRICIDSKVMSISDVRLCLHGHVQTTWTPTQPAARAAKVRNKYQNFGILFSVERKTTATWMTLK